jgi:hypothetical protein
LQKMLIHYMHTGYIVTCVLDMRLGIYITCDKVVFICNNSISEMQPVSIVNKVYDFMWNFG